MPSSFRKSSNLEPVRGLRFATLPLLETFLCQLDIVIRCLPCLLDQFARQTPSFRAGKDSADGGAVLRHGGLTALSLNSRSIGSNAVVRAVRTRDNISMERLQAYQYELRPNGAQQRDLRRFAGACRFVFNKALALQQANHAAGEKFIGYVAMARHLTAWRNDTDTAWLKDAPCHPLQHPLKDLERAYQNLFAKRADFPRFRRKGAAEAFRYPDPKQIKLDQTTSRIFLPKLGWLRYRNSRVALGEVRNVTVRRVGDKWLMAVQTRREVAAPVPTATSAVGIDVGIAPFATLSDGTCLAARHSFKQQQARLAGYQRTTRPKVKFSRTWKQAK